MAESGGTVRRFGAYRQQSQQGQQSRPPVVRPSGPATTPAQQAQPPVKTVERLKEERVEQLKAEEKIVAYLRREESVKGVKDVLSGGKFASEEARTAQARKVLDYAVAQVCDKSNDRWSALMMCSPEDIFAATRKLAAFGLLPDHVRGYGFLSPRFLRKEEKMSCVPIPGVRGMEKALMESGAVSVLKSNAIREQDFFDCVEGTEEKIVFRRCLHPKEGQTNRIIGSYAFVEMKDGRRSIITKAVNAEELKADRMDLESAARYVALRAAMRDAIRTFMEDNESLMNLVQMEDEANRTGTAVTPEAESIRRGTDVPQVVPAQVQASTPAPQETVASQDPLSRSKASIADNDNDHDEEEEGQRL